MLKVACYTLISLLAFTAAGSLTTFAEEEPLFPPEENTYPMPEDLQFSIEQEDPLTQDEIDFFPPNEQDLSVPIEDDPFIQVNLEQPNE